MPGSVASAGRFGVRAAVLAISIATVVTALAFPLKVYLSQQASVHSLAAEQQADTAEIAHLRGELKDWQQPGYIEEQARNRLNFVLPGQTEYLLMGTGRAGARAKDRSAVRLAAGTTTLEPAAGQSWYSELWKTDLVAGQARVR